MPHFFKMGEAPESLGLCSTCEREAKRVFSSPQLVTQPERCSEANKKGLAEMNATAKADEKAYNKRWDRRMQSL